MKINKLLILEAVSLKGIATGAKNHITAYIPANIKFISTIKED